MSCRNIFVFQFKYKPSCVELKSLQNQLKQTETTINSFLSNKSQNQQNNDELQLRSMILQKENEISLIKQKIQSYDNNIKYIKFNRKIFVKQSQQLKKQIMLLNTTQKIDNKNRLDEEIDITNKNNFNIPFHFIMF